MQYRCAIIGCGYIGTGGNPNENTNFSHAKAYQCLDNADLAAICDTDEENLKASADKWEVKQAYKDPKAMLSEIKPDIVSICTPNHTHSEILRLVLTTPSVKAVLIEKPIALNGDDAGKILALASQHKIVLSVNYSRRFSPGHHWVKQMILSKRLGQIQSVMGYYTKGILHNGTHWIDLARWLVGEIELAEAVNHRDWDKGDCQVDAWFKFENGARGFLQGLDATHFSLFEMDIIGTLGRLKLVDSGNRLEYFQVSNSPYYPGYQTLLKIEERDGEMGQNILWAVKNLIQSLEESTSPACTGLDGQRALEIGLSLFPNRIHPL